MKRSSSSKALRGKRSGFTRPEAVAALGITGALAGVFVPAAAQGSIFDLIFGGARNNPRTTSCQSNQKQIGLGLMQYVQDYDEMLPLATSKGQVWGWAEELQPYIKSTQLFQCPAEKHPVRQDAPSGRSYFINAGATDYWFNRNASGKPLAQMMDVPRIISTGDGDGGSAASDARYNIAALPSSWLNTKGSPARRHVRSSVEGANYGFLDGHVKWYQPASISTASLAKAGANPTFATK